MRHFFDEFGYAQFMSTPEGHNLRQLDVHAYLLTERFVHECAGNQQFRGRFNLNRAHTLLKDSWNAERQLLGDGADYWRSLDRSRTVGAIRERRALRCIRVRCHARYLKPDPVGVSYICGEPMVAGKPQGSACQKKCRSIQGASHVTDLDKSATDTRARGSGK